MKMLKMQNSKIILIQKLRIDRIFFFKKKNMGMISNEKKLNLCVVFWQTKRYLLLRCILTYEKIFIIALYFDKQKDYCVVF